MEEVIEIPDLGNEINKVTMASWHKNPGDLVDVDETICEIYTDKVMIEIPSPIKGVLKECFYQQGDTIRVGEKIALVQSQMDKNTNAMIN